MLKPTLLSLLGVVLFSLPAMAQEDAPKPDEAPDVHVEKRGVIVLHDIGELDHDHRAVDERAQRRHRLDGPGDRLAEMEAHLDLDDRRRVFHEFQTIDGHSLWRALDFATRAGEAVLGNPGACSQERL